MSKYLFDTNVFGKILKMQEPQKMLKSRIT